ncbi:hypothetical protein [Herbidospora daliensis]|uniref:hypothetical protein n=1 Tax=Herbidospora daliensis TaxID=295585 RepID=UPI000A70E4F9|nr:hypothetical protein [Herbidospora daliensis]
MTLEWADDQFTVRLGTTAEVILWKSFLSSVRSMLRHLPEGHFEARIGMDVTAFGGLYDRWADDAPSIDLGTRVRGGLRGDAGTRAPRVAHGVLDRVRRSEAAAARSDRFHRGFRAAVVHLGFTQVNDDSKS